MVSDFKTKVSSGEFTVTVDDLSDGLERIYQGQEDVPFSTGWKLMDEFYRVQLGEWCVVSGIASHGKSAWLDCLWMNLAKKHGMKFSIFSPENKPYQRHLRKLVEIYAGDRFRSEWGENVSLMPRQDVEKAKAFISEHFKWVDLETATLDKLLDIHDHHVINYGCTGVVIDPWNECEHDYGGKTETEYISRSLSVFRSWARSRKIALWIVAHPTKMQRNRDGAYPMPTLWDISGSSHWRNKADVGIVCYRKDMQKHGLTVQVQKVRFKTSGKPGDVEFLYDPMSNRMKPATCSTERKTDGRRPSS